MEKRTKVINGRSIDYLDVVHHTTTTKFDFWDRIKILFGSEVVTESELYTNHDHCLIVGSEAKTRIPSLIKRKHKGGLVQYTPLNQDERRDLKLNDVLK